MTRLWHYIVNLNIDKVSDEWESRNLRLINTLIFCLFLIMVMYFGVSHIIEVPEARPVILVAMVAIGLHFVLSKQCSLNLIKFYFSLMPVAIIFIVAVFIVGKGAYDKFYFVNTLVLPLIIFKDKRWYMPLSIFNILMFFLTFYLQEVIEPMAKINESSLQVYGLINCFAICTISIVMIKSFKNEIFSFQELISHQKLILEEKNIEITDSIKYAKGIQEALLPSQTFLNDKFSNGYVLYLPKDIVAGDFYWMEQVDEDLYFAAADCTGHGVPGAMVSVVCFNALNQSLNEHGNRRVNQLLDKTSELVSETFAKSERIVKDGMDIALCKLNINSNQLEFSGANNPLWIISSSENLNTESNYRTLDVDGKYLHEIKATKKPVGNSDSTTGFELHTIQLDVGDEIILFTDGFADQFGGERGKKYKYANFKKFLLAQQGKDRTLLLKQEFNNWKGDLEQVDDVCVIGYQISQ